MKLDVAINSKSILRALGSMKSQVAFASSQALNDTAFDVRKQIVERTYPRSFNVRNTGFPRTAFRVSKASKRHLEAAVYDRTESEWLTRQATGGIKRAPGGGRVAVPTSKVQRTARGRVKKPQTPTALLRGRGFKSRGKGGEAIVKPNRGKRDVYYFLRDRVVVKKRFPFEEAATKRTRAVYAGHFGRRLKAAIRTAR